MHDETTRDGGGAGYGAARGIEAAVPRPSPAAPVPPMEADWLRVVRGGHGLAGAPNDAPSPRWQGNGGPAPGVDSTRGGH